MRVRADTLQDADAIDPTESAPSLSRIATEIEYAAPAATADPYLAESTTVASLDGGDGAICDGGDLQLLAGTNPATP